jgi:hypothetical protein
MLELDTKIQRLIFRYRLPNKLQDGKHNEQVETIVVGTWRAKLLTSISALAVSLSVGAETIVLSCTGKYSGLVFSHGGSSDIEESSEIIEIAIYEKTYNGVRAKRYNERFMEFVSPESFQFGTRVMPRWSLLINRQTARVELSKIEIGKFDEVVYTAFLNFQGSCHKVEKSKF